MGVLQNCWAGNFVSANNEYLDCGAHSAFSFSPGLNPFSVHAWIKTSSAVNGDRTVIGRALTGSEQYAIQVNGSFLQTKIGGEAFSVNVFTAIGVTLNDDSWHQIVVTFSTTQARVYVDGAAVITHNFTGTDVVAANLLIGGHNNTSTANTTDHFDGLIDEPGIWSSELTAAEVTALWNGGVGLMLGIDSGSYVSSDTLEGWWRLGDGATENPDTGPTVTVEDGSGYGRNGTINSAALDLGVFYWGGNNSLQPIPGEATCDLFISSSSISALVTPSFTLSRTNLSNLSNVVGYEGNVHRMTVTVTGTAKVATKLLVMEYGRPFPGSTIRKEVFRRVARLTDLTTVPEDTPGSKFPFAYRVSVITIYADTAAKIEASWLEIQRMATRLSLDMQEFGIPVFIGGPIGIGTPVFKYGVGAESPGGNQHFPAIVPPDILLSSSSSVALIIPSSSSFSLPPPLVSSSSSFSLPPPATSSSSDYVDPNQVTNRHVHVDSAADSVTRFDDNGIKTLFTDLGFVRFGRNMDPGQTWDSFFRFPMDMPWCAPIESAVLHLFIHTAESGQDVVLRAHDLYGSADFTTSVGAFSGTSDPAFPRSSLVFDQLPPVSLPGIEQLLFDVTDMVQFFVNRGSYLPGSDYFGLWIAEEVSDPGARRDATADSALLPYLRMTYRTDGLCSSSTTG